MRLVRENKASILENPNSHNMEISPEESTPQNPVGGTPAAPAPATPPQEGEMVTISKKEFEDLSHRASVSSQNFERLQKAQEDLAEARRLQGANNGSTPDPELQQKIETLSVTVNSLQSELDKSKLVAEHPVLKDAWQDFEAFRQLDENKGMSVATAAKAFMVEKGLTDPSRPGLDRPTGGPRTPPATGMMSPDDAKKLRETDYRKYRQMLEAGQIRIGE